MSLKTFKKVGLIAIGTGVALATIATVMIDRKSVKYDDPPPPPEFQAENEI